MKLKIRMNEWMNEFLEQLVKGPTAAYRQKLDRPGERVSPGFQISCLFSVILVAGNQMLIKLPYLNICLTMRCLSLISVFFTHSLRDVLRKGQGTVSKRRGLIACVQTTTPTANFWAQIIFDPYRRLLTLTYLRVSTRRLFQDTMFDRLHTQNAIRGYFRSFSATAYCGIEKANSMARVVVKPTPRLCNRCASNT